MIGFPGFVRLEKDGMKDNATRRSRILPFWKVSPRHNLHAQREKTNMISAFSGNIHLRSDNRRKRRLGVRASTWRFPDDV